MRAVKGADQGAAARPLCLVVPIEVAGRGAVAGCSSGDRGELCLAGVAHEALEAPGEAAGERLLLGRPGVGGVGDVANAPPAMTCEEGGGVGGR
jgi:hypothetical protein